MSSSTRPHASELVNSMREGAKPDLFGGDDERRPRPLRCRKRRRDIASIAFQHDWRVTGLNAHDLLVSRGNGDAATGELASIKLDVLIAEPLDAEVGLHPRPARMTQLPTKLAVR